MQLQAEKALLTRTENGAYRRLTEEERCQIGNHPETQERIGEDSSAKVNIGKAREGEVITGGAASLPPDNSPLTDFEKRILELYVTHCQGMAECRYLDEGIRGKIAALKQRGWTEEAITEAFRIAGESPFLKGENKERWIASLEWLCEDENLRKVCGGKYQAYRKAAPQGATGNLGQAELDRGGYVIADETTRTSIPGFYAVGDVRTKQVRQVVTAVADGAVAVHYASEYLG